MAMKANRFLLNQGITMAEKTLQMIARLRDGTEVKGEAVDVSNYPEDELRDAMESFATIARNIKSLSYLRLNLGTVGTAVIHPDDISYIRLYGSTIALRKMVQEYL